MSGLLSLSSLALRFLVVMVVVAAVATLLRLRSQPSSAGLQPVAVALAAEPAPPAPKPVWHLGFNGWLIRVDNADVAIPSLAEQIQARRQARLAWTVSPFDDLIIHHSDAHGFDWRLVAALIFEESKFDPDSESDRGAVGLMQVRPVAAEAVGEASSKDPDDNIRTGVSYLHQLDDMFADVGDDDRMCLVLAAYNIGPGHVHDAQLLARRFGYNPKRWEGGVEQMLPLLEQPQIYKDLANGFGQGSSTVAYVNRILERYENYQREAPSLHETTADSDTSNDASHG